jgi:hypothetical protein
MPPGSGRRRLLWQITFTIPERCRIMRRFFPPIVIGFVLFGVFLLGVSVKLNTISFGCSVNGPKWYLDLPPIVGLLQAALCLPGIIAAIVGPFFFGDSDAMLYFNLFFGQSVGYWLAGHAVNWLFRAVRNARRPQTPTSPDHARP